MGTGVRAAYGEQGERGRRAGGRTEQEARGGQGQEACRPCCSHSTSAPRSVSPGAQAGGGGGGSQARATTSADAITPSASSPFVFRILAVWVRCSPLIFRVLPGWSESRELSVCRSAFPFLCAPSSDAGWSPRETWAGDVSTPPAAVSASPITAADPARATGRQPAAYAPMQLRPPRALLVLCRAVRLLQRHTEGRLSLCQKKICASPHGVYSKKGGDAA